MKALSRDQWLTILVSILALAILYFGFDIKPKSQKQLEKTRAFNIEATSIENLIREAKMSLGSRYGLIESIYMELSDEKNDSLKVEKLKQLSGKWYEMGFPAISGYYAEEIAKNVDGGESWAMAGTTYLLSVQQAQEEKVKIWSFNRAVKAFEAAISLEPHNLSHRINLALVYVELPPSDQPMKGILMLRSLEEEFPDNVQILTQLGRLSIRTNQLENALKRLKQAEEIDPKNKNVICLLAIVYEKLSDQTNAEKYSNQCVQ